MTRAFHLAGLVWLAATAAFVGLGWNPLIGALAGALVLIIMVIKRKLPFWAFVAAVAFCISLLNLWLYDTLTLAPARAWEGSVQNLRAVVVDRVDYASYSVLSLRLDAPAPRGLAGERVRVTANAGLDVSVGDVVECKWKLQTDPRKRIAMYARGERFEAVPLGTIAVVGARLHVMDVQFARYRARIAQNITHMLPGEEGAVLVGMLLGRTESIDPDVRYNYARAGIVHLLSVSGLHLSILVGQMESVLRALRISRRKQAIAAMGGVLLFMALVGFCYPVIRAGIMMLIYLSAGLFGRDSDSLNSLGLALVVMLLANPYAAFSLSLMLSYLATLGIAAFSHPMTVWLFRDDEYTRRKGRIGRWSFALVQAGATSVAACVLTAPLLCWNFGQISLVAALVNLLIAPLEAGALGCGLLGGFLAFFPATRIPARICGLIAGVSMKLINALAAWWSALPFAAVSVRSDYVIIWMSVVLTAGVLLWAANVKREVMRYAACISVLPLLAGAVAHAAAWGTVVELAAVNGGQAVAVVYGRQGAVIGTPESMYAARSLRAFLDDRGVRELVLLVGAREDALHTNPVMLLTEGMPPRTALGLDNTHGFTADLFGQATVSADGFGAEFVTIKAGGLRIVKAFTQTPHAADLLINRRNELIYAPDTDIWVNTRYFNSSVIALREIKHDIPTGK